MGVIKRQSIKYSIVQMLGMIIGIFSTIYIYPHDKETLGLFRFLSDTAYILVPLFMLGTSALSTKFFILFSDTKSKKTGFYLTMIIISTIGFLLLLLFIFIFKSQILAYFGSKSSILYTRYLFAILPISFSFMLVSLFKQFAANEGLITVPNLLEQGIKIFFPLLLILFISKKINLDIFIYAIMVYYIGICLVTGFYSIRISKLNMSPMFDFKNSTINKEMLNYALFNILGTTGGVLALRIDTFMVSTMIDLKNTGIYAIASTIATVISFPLSAVYGISSPIISKALHENNNKEVENIYKKSSINLMILGILMFLIIWCNIDKIFELMSNSEQMRIGKYVIFFLIFAKLFDLATGVNDAIINFSKHYRFTLISISILAGLNIAGNLIMIPEFGLLGAAIAPALASFVFNSLKWAYIKYHFKITPFTNKTWVLIVISGLTFGITLLFPNINNPYLSILVKSTFILILFGSLVIYLGISEEVNKIIEGFLGKIIDFKK
jgi:O-antigen/teichoic acid export membrane protein